MREASGPLSGSSGENRQDRVPGRWWWFRIIVGVALLVWRTILVAALHWH